MFPSVALWPRRLPCTQAVLVQASADPVFFFLIFFFGGGRGGCCRLFVCFFFFFMIFVSSFVFPLFPLPTPYLSVTSFCDRRISRY